MASSKKLALLVGCNYAGESCALHGCINDVNSIKEMLKTPRFGFKETNISLLTDDKNSEVEQPTGKNIKKRLQEMAKNSKPGDLLLFYFSGHGMRGNFTGNSPLEDEEAIVPSDFNVITKYDFRHVVNKVHDEATFLLISDSCHSGGLIDKEEQQVREVERHSIPLLKESRNVKAKRLKYVDFLARMGCEVGTCLSDIMYENFLMASSMCFHETKDYMPKIKKDKGILISGCRSEEFSFDLKVGLGENHEPHGAFTTALLTVLQQDGQTLSNLDVVLKVTKVLVVDNKFNQHSCLYTEKTNVNTAFLLQDSTVVAREIGHPFGFNQGLKGSVWIDILADLTDIAGTYLRKSSDITQKKLDLWVDRLDHDKNGKANVRDVYRVLINKEGCNVEVLSKFAHIIGWEVELDRDQVLALYYASKSLIKFCGVCSKYLNSIYFSCLTCFSTRDLEFDICASCLNHGKTCPQPDHNNFLDNHALLRFYRLRELKYLRGDTKGDVAEETSRKLEINIGLEDLETSFWKEAGVNEAFKDMPSAKDSSQLNIGLINHSQCSIM